MLQFHKHQFKLNFDIIKSLIHISWPATLQFLIASGSWIVIAKIVAETGGTTASAGFQIALRNVVFFIMPAWGLSNAAATLVGQNLGAKQIQRAEKSVQITLKYNAIRKSAFQHFTICTFHCCEHFVDNCFNRVFRTLSICETSTNC